MVAIKKLDQKLKATERKMLDAMEEKLTQLVAPMDASFATKFDALHSMFPTTKLTSPTDAFEEGVRIADLTLQSQVSDPTQPYLPDGFPRFDGHDFCNWINRCEQCFSLENISNERRMKL